MTKDLVSIITPSYNCGRYIADTIRSVQAQSYGKWELVIVDDCSTDQTRQVVESFSRSDPRIRYYCMPENSGAAAARTKAMELAEGEFMAFLDSDDVWTPDKLSRQLSFMRDNSYAFTCTAYEKMQEDGTLISGRLRALKKTSYRRLLLDCPVGNSTVMYNVEKMGKFCVPDIRKRNDDALWLQMLRKVPYIYGLDEVLMRYRVRQDSISGKKLDLVRYHWQLYRDIEHLGVLRSAFHIGWWGFIKVFHIKK